MQTRPWILPQGARALTYTVNISLAGTAYVYDMANATRLDDFHGPGFIQQCYRCADQIPALTVFIRPDANSSRVEVVVELGRVWGAANAAAAHLGPYTLQVLKDGVAISPVISVPMHWWMARWRWQSAPRPIIRSWSQLLAAKLIPPYGTKGIPGTITPIDPKAFVYKGPMDNAGVMEYMPETGGRLDIGLWTEIAANAVLNPNDAAAQAAVLAWGEVAGTVPNHPRDENTGALVSVLQYPLFNTTSVNRGGTWARGNASIFNPTDPNAAPTSGWTDDDAHYPSLSYPAFVMTGDPYFLENMEGEALEVFTETAYWSGIAGGTTAYINRDQDRDYGWSLRALLETRRAMELAEVDGPIPSWMHNSAYYKTICDNQLTQYTSTWVNNPTAAGTVFSAGPEIAMHATWQGDFEGQVLNTAVWLGYDEWRPALTWKTKSVIDRVNLYPAYPSFYWFSLGPGLFNVRNPDPTSPSAPKAADYYPDWKTAIAGYPAADPSQWKPGEYDALVADPTNGGKLSPSASPDYALQAYAHLAFSTANGVPGAAQALAKITPMIITQEARCSIMASADGTVVVPPPVNPPPTEIQMPTTASLNVGQTITLKLNNTQPPNADLSSLTYHTPPDGIVSTLKVGNDVQVKGLKAGTTKVLGDANGVDTAGNPVALETECDVTVSVAIPLAVSLGTLDKVS